MADGVTVVLRLGLRPRASTMLGTCPERAKRVEGPRSALTIVSRGEASRARERSDRVEGHSRMAWYVYLLQCGNGNFYAGVTADLDRRLAEHQSGIGGRFTKAVRPIKLVYHETFDSHITARQREAQLKGWSKAKKVALAAGDVEALKRS